MLTRRSALALAALGAAAATAACTAPETGGSASGENSAGGSGAQGGPLRISAIPDQDPDVLTEREEALAAYLAEALGIDVEYVPVPDYAASVAQFGTGDLDLVFYGGLTGVQARLQNPDCHVIAQRDIDERFTSIFIAHEDSGIDPVDDVAGLEAMAGTRFTFGSETSTSGRLMPSYFLKEAGVAESDLEGEPGFSGSHDTTLELVASGSYQAGALNSQVWRTREEAGEIPETVVKVLESPEYHDYHWLLAAGAAERLGADLPQRITEALLSAHEDEAGQAILEQYGAESFIAAEAEDYSQIEDVARELGLVG